MNINKTILAGSLLLLLSAERSPAPIAEETPSPTPTASSTAASSAAANQLSRQDAARFAGTWTGKIKFGGFAAEVEYTLVINSEATSLILKSQRTGENARPTTVNNGTLSWTTGVRDSNAWTLTPNPDGHTALVKVKPSAGADGTATFQRSYAPIKRGRAGARLKTHQ